MTFTSYCDIHTHGSTQYDTALDLDWPDAVAKWPLAPASALLVDAFSVAFVGLGEAEPQSGSVSGTRAASVVSGLPTSTTFDCVRARYTFALLRRCQPRLQAVQGSCNVHTCQYLVGNHKQ